MNLRTWMTAATVVFVVVSLAGAASRKTRPAVRSTAPSRSAAAAVSGLSVEQIDTRLSQAEGEIAAANARIGQLRQDSIRTATDGSRSLSGVAAQIAQLDGDIARRKGDISGLKAQRDKARADSTALAFANKVRVSELARQKSQLDGRITAVSVELDAVNRRRGDLARDDGSAGERAVAAAQADAGRNDSLLRMRQTELPGLSKKRDQARQDSITQGTQAVDYRHRWSAEVRRLDSLLQINGAAAAVQEQRRAKAKQDSAAAVGQERQKALSLNEQRKQVQATAVRTKGESVAAAAERDRLKATAGAAQGKINAQRLPLESAVTALEAQIQSRSAESGLLHSLREKISIDSIINKTRDEIDALVMASAKGDRNAKKQISPMEDKLGEMLAKQDDFKRMNGLLQKESQFAGLTTSQKKRMVDSILAAGQSEAASMASRRDKAKLDLAEFDRTHPAADPAAQARILQLDGTVTTKEREYATLNAQADSLDRAAQAVQGGAGQMAASMRTEVGRADSAVTVFARERTTLTAQKSQAKSDSARSESAMAATTAGANSGLSAAVAQVALADREIATFTVSRDKARQAVLDQQERNRQARTALLQEKQKLDTQASQKEQEIASLRGQAEKLAQEMQAAVRAYEENVRANTAANARLDADIAARNRDLGAVSLQKDSLAREKVSLERTMQNGTRAAQLQLLNAARQLSGAQTEVESLRRQRQQALQNLRQGLQQADADIDRKRTEIASLQSQRDQLAAKIAAAENRPAPVPSYTAPAPTHAAPPPPPPPAGGVSQADQAQKDLETIYTLISEDKYKEAVIRFGQQKEMLQRNLAADAFQTLQSTVQQYVGKK